MTGTITKVIGESPEVLVFLSLAIGYFVGKLKYKGFSLGTTASVLLVAIMVGQFTIEVPMILKDIAFALFAFCIGYQVGPQFFGSLRKEGLNYLWIALVVALVGLATAVLLGQALGYDKGTTAGLFAGAMTQSAVIGTASGAIDHLSISEAAKQTLNNNIVIAYAITYIFGTVGVILLFKLMPGFMGIKLKDEARTLEEKMGGGSDLSKYPELFSWSRNIGLRAYVAANPVIFGKSIVEVEKLFPDRMAIDKIKRGNQLMDFTPETIIQAQDILVIAGRCAALSFASKTIGEEVDVSGVTDLIGEVLDVCVLNPAVVGKTLSQAASLPLTHGIFLSRITRQGHPLPFTRDTVINKCDIVRIVGAKDDIERVAKLLGYAERPSPVTDLVMVGTGCVLGTLLGVIVIRLAGIPLTLGTGGGVLVAGLFFGWLRSINPTFGQIPDGAQWLLNDFGLSLFVACVGLSSGRAALQALQTNGLSIFLAGIVLAIVPILAGLLFGKYFIKMNPVLLLGALTGARVIPPALNALEEDAGSNALALGFAAPFAFANVFLTVMGSVIINIVK